MADGSKAVGLFSRTEIDDTFALDWKVLGITGKQTVRDLWRNKDVGAFDNQFETTIPHHGVVLLKITPAK